MSDVGMALEIADYIIAALADVDDLNEIKAFVRGPIPGGFMPQDLYPCSEVIVYQETEDSDQPRMTGNVYGRVYQGIVTLNVLSINIAGGDWIDRVEDRKIVVPSYGHAIALAAIALAELSKCEHNDLGALSHTVGTAVEVVTWFSPANSLVYGADRATRENNWENFASFEFSVRTQRTVT